MNLILMGSQGAGKGAQAKLLSKKLNIPILATGGIFRNKKSEGDLEIASYIDKGMLVPDEIANRIVKEELSKSDYDNGVVLDGYPRNESQAKFLSEYFNINKVIFLDVPDAIVLKRIAGRRICRECGAVFNINSNPPKQMGVCDVCGGKVEQRHDDTEQAIAKRLNIYHELTELLIEYYEKDGKLLRVDGTKNIEEVFEEINNNL